MQILIDIPEESYKATCNGCMLPPDVENVVQGIKNGTPLPKGHGRLIDENYLLCFLQCEEYETCTWRNCEDCNRENCIRRHNLSEFPAIIEADTVESRDKI